MKSLLAWIPPLLLLTFSCQQGSEKAPIDRYALVTRHNIVTHAFDTLGSLSVGNGEFAFTVDASGLQTFPGLYENGIPLGTQSQWAWHSFPDKQHYTLKDVAEEFESCDGSKAPYPIQHKTGRLADATQTLRSNRHRMHLGTIGLILLKDDGSEVKIEDFKNIDQQLDLWSGKITSSYDIESKRVTVTLYSSQQDDGIAVRINSPLLSEHRLKVKFRFPYPNSCHTCSGYEWGNKNKHQSILQPHDTSATINRLIDSSRYHVNINWNAGTIRETGLHEFILSPSVNNNIFEFTAAFTPDYPREASSFAEVEEFNLEHWKNFWSTGGAVDFSQCTDERAPELERRVILSQYLTKIQCSGSLPPQETGLTMNSWYGKFHLEMHWWHAAHFASWNRIALLEKSMDWYQRILPAATATAQAQRFKGARWPKMTDPSGNESPSDIGAFIIWQQAHPIYFAELLYRNYPDPITLDKYQDIVFGTADFMTAFLKLKDGKFHLCHPLMPAQEVYNIMETDDPTFELQYWHWALSIAQQWRVRMGKEENKEWKDVLENMAGLPALDGRYLPNGTTSTAYTNDAFRKDHPAVLGTLGFLPLNERIDTVIMRATLTDILNKWDWNTTWGWDYPMIAMNATRLGKPDLAIEALLMDVPKNRYLVNGHNYQDKNLRLYLPGNGGLLSAVALMAAGWDGNATDNPGFPKDGKWKIVWEGLRQGL